MNLVIQDDEGQIIYGHEVLKRIAQTGMTPEVNIVRGILPECFIAYVSRQFPEVKEVRDLAASSEINYKLLEAVGRLVPEVQRLLRSDVTLAEEVVSAVLNDHFPESIH